MVDSKRLIRFAFVYDSKNKTTPYERIFFSEMYVRTGQTIQFNSIREDHILIFPDYNPSISICLRFSLQNTLRECFNLAMVN